MCYHRPQPPPPPPPAPYGCVALALPKHGPSCMDLGLLVAFFCMLVATLYAIAHAVHRPDSDELDAQLDASLQALLAVQGGQGTPPIGMSTTVVHVVVQTMKP